MADDIIASVVAGLLIAAISAIAAGLWHQLKNLRSQIADEETRRSEHEQLMADMRRGCEHEKLVDEALRTLLLCKLEQQQDTMVHDHHGVADNDFKLRAQRVYDAYHGLGGNGHGTQVNNGRVARRTRAWNTIAAILRPAYNGGATSSGGGTGRLTVDGSCGPATIRRWQQVMGTSVDGIISGQYRPDGRTWGRPALVDSCVRYGGGGSNLIRAVQRKLSLTADGLLGPATIRALQKHLGVAQDSWFGPGTARALQSRLNTGRF